MSDLERGDVVDYDGAKDHKRPYTVAVVFHSGGVRLRDRYGYDKVLSGERRETFNVRRVEAKEASR